MRYWDVFRYRGYPSLALGAFRRVPYSLSESPRREKGFDVSSHGDVLLEVTASNEKMRWQRHGFKCLSLLFPQYPCSRAPIAVTPLFLVWSEWVFLSADKAGRPPPVPPLGEGERGPSLLPSR